MTKATERAEAARYLGAFVDAGAQPVETAILQPAETLLDLYGEDIRARAFTTHGPGGEAMLRPDFTVPVVQMHMREGGDPARYAYAGEVFRRQALRADRPAEYLQVGFELFGGDPAVADAECFALFHGVLSPLAPRIQTGDIGILTAAVRGLTTSETRKAALLRHVWRPRRFRTLLERFAGRVAVPPQRSALLIAADPLAGAGPEIGLRDRADVMARIEALRADAAEPPIPATEVGLIDDILDLKESSDAALQRLRDMAVDMPAIEAAVAGLGRRLEALDAAGIAPETLPFEGSHGRSTMEYYDGFVFSFSARQRPDLPPLSTGGRYDALTRVLGQGRATPAVGGVIRPALTLEAAQC
ncbi:ATP phosphoribosyltransferase regulatory subunit [Palleronia abyssalis]|uniref:Histidine--tRNA ligase n=1 Tax=Palleronia abyssalis TaxID=1501240 RepID=A0A2R8BYX0_9RHOB|nr:ATP phosphoribosyltransferase regulatory subunit [Palleronia abyssalis]SPJ25367.1 ATP phosphoribosyltransferase regulatory subunit [Palleronia abyssalis]